MPEPTKYDKRSADNNAMLPFWLKVSTIIGGEDAVKNAGKTYLPMMPQETRAQFDFRLQCAKFTNVYRDIAETLAAKPFAEEISLVDGAPPEIESLFEDIDGDGNNITVFASDVFFKGINDAITWIFIDSPNTSDQIRTIADMKQAKIRPFWSSIVGQNMLEIRTTKIGAESVISYARILEPGAKGDEENKVRIFERTDNLVSWQVMAQSSRDVWFIESQGTLSIPMIPLVPFITGRRDGKRWFFHPTLQDAVDLQMVLYRQESALEYAKIMTAFPMLSASGVKPRTDAQGNPMSIAVGPQTVLYAPPDGNGNVGSWAYVEPGAASLQFLAADVKETKQDLRELGKQPLTAQAGLTVITTAYAAGKAKTAVGAWGLGLKDTLENALVITVAFLGIDYDPQVNVYDEYDTFSDGDFNSVMELRKNSDISRETTWKEAKRRGILASEFDETKETALLLTEESGNGTDEFLQPPTPEDDKENPNE